MHRKSRYYTQLSLLSAVLVILAFTPIGSIQLPLIKATTTHIPVIIGAILLGMGAGMFLGTLFGIVSVIRSTLFPTLTTFVFSPFLSVPGETGGNWAALLVAFVPRILIGVAVAKLYQVLRKIELPKMTQLIVCAIFGSMVNTIGVLSLIYLLYGAQYALVLELTHEALVSFLLTVLLTNGIGEAIVAGIIAPAICYGIIKSGYIGGYS